jgi:hypothetical protein
LLSLPQYLSTRSFFKTDLYFLDQKELAGNRQHEGTPPQGLVSFILTNFTLTTSAIFPSSLFILNTCILYYFGKSDHAIFCQRIKEGYSSTSLHYLFAVIIPREILVSEMSISLFSLYSIQKVVLETGIVILH